MTPLYNQILSYHLQQEIYPSNKLFYRFIFILHTSLLKRWTYPTKTFFLQQDISKTTSVKFKTEIWKSELSSGHLGRDGLTAHPYQILKRRHSSHPSTPSGGWGWVRSKWFHISFWNLSSSNTEMCLETSIHLKRMKSSAFMPLIGIWATRGGQGRKYQK